MNNPTKYIDPDGTSTWVKLVDGMYQVFGGNLDDKDYNIYLYTQNKDGEWIRGNSIGITTSITSFYDDTFNSDTGKDYGWLGTINPNDKSGENFLGDIFKNTPSLEEYMPNATKGGDYDFKRTNGSGATYEGKTAYYRGMPIGTNNGIPVYTSARDIGNIAAGYVAAANGMPWGASRVAFDALETYQKKNPSIEGYSTRNAEYFGWKLGNSNTSPQKKAGNFRKSIQQFFGF